MGRASLALGGALGLATVGLVSAGASAAMLDDPPEEAVTGSPCVPDVSAVGTPGAMPRGLTAENAHQAKVMARTTGNPVEDISQRTESSQVFANPDGTWMLSDFLGDNWVQTGGDGDSAADWSAIDLTLELGADGLVRPSVYAGSLTLAPGGKKTDTIIASAMGDSGVVLKVLWDGSTLPPVVLDGARATYPDVWPGVDYVVDVTMSGFEQYFVLKTRAAAIARADDLFLPVAVDGGSLAEDEAGGLVVLDATGSVVAIVPVAAAWDASEDDTHLSPVLQPWSAEPHLASGVSLPGLPKSLTEKIENGTKGRVMPQSRPVEIVLSPHGRGKRVGLEVDEGWLADPGTVYPVIVDPTYAVVQRNATYDTYVASSAPTSNFGTSTETRIGSTDGGATKSRTYFTFDTSTIKDKEIISASLVLWNYWSATCTPNYWYAFWSAPASSSTTWNNQPALRSSVYTSSTDTEGHTSLTLPWCPEDWANIDVTVFAQAWVHRAEDSQGLFLTTYDETILARWKRFYSLENSSANKPHINYYYDRAPGVPTSVTLNDEALADEMSVDPDENGEFWVAATVTDADGDLVQALFTIKQGGIVIVDSLPGDMVQSGQASKAKLPYGLASNAEYTIEVQASDGMLMGEAYSPTDVFHGPEVASRDLSPDSDDETGVAP